MKQRISLPLPLVFILTGALMLSLVFNYAQYDLANNPPKSPLMGTYQAGNAPPQLFTWSLTIKAISADILSKMAFSKRESILRTHRNSIH